MKNKGMLYLAIMNLFIVFVGVGLVIPVIPSLMDEMHFSGSTAGMMVSVFAIAQLISSPITGVLTDKIGRKILIVIGMIIFSVSEGLFGIAQTIPVFYVSRALGGLSAAMIMPAVTGYIADITTLAERPKAMGLVSAAISGGFVIGPGLGGLIAHFGIRAPFYAAAVLALIGFILSVFILKEPERQNFAGDKDAPKESVLDILKKPAIFFLFIIILISSFGLQAFESIYSIMAARNFGFNTNDIAMIMMFSGLLALICQVMFFEGIVEKIGEIGLIQISFFASAIFIGMIAITKHNWVVVVATFVVFLAFDLFRPAVTTYLSKNAGENQGAINGLNSTFTSFGNILGPLAAGQLFDFNHHLPYVVSAAILLGTGILSLFLTNDVRKKKNV